MSQDLAIALAVAVVLPQVAAAEVLTADDAAHLCVASYEGKRAVDRDALAYAIVTEAGAGLYLDGSNRAGLRDRAIQLRTADGNLSEPVYAVLYAGRDDAEPAAAKPFGPNVDLRTDNRALKARDAIAKVYREELISLTIQGALVKGPTLTYRIRRRVVVGAPATENEWRNPELLFLADPALVILCESHVEAPSTPAPVGEKSESSGIDLVDRVRLRGAVKDLTVKIDNLDSVKPASLSYERDGVANTMTFEVNGVLGLRFGNANGSFDAIPFISYENRSVTGNEGDVKKLAPGLLVGYRMERPKVALHTRLEASFVEDIQQDSRQAKLRAYIDPAFVLGTGRGILFGTYLKAIGVLQLRPDLTLILDGSHVYDEGNSPDLAGASDYFGAGGELSVRSRLALGAPISDLVLQVAVRHLSLFGDIQEDDAGRWVVSLDYCPQNFPYIGIALSFSKGKNDDTFQDEETYGLVLTFRY